MTEPFYPARVLGLERQFEMTERVAKAMFLAEHPNAKWSAGRVRMLWFTRAAAAIEAMREPTVDMIAATLPQTGNPTDDQRALGALGLARLGKIEPVGITIAGELVRDWQAMVDAAKFPWGGEAE